MDGTLPKISFLKLQGREGGSNNNPRLDGGRWYGLRPLYNSKYSHQDLSNEGSKKPFEFCRTCLLSSSNMGNFLMNFRFWLLEVQLRKSIQAFLDLRC